MRDRVLNDRLADTDDLLAHRLALDDPPDLVILLTMTVLPLGDVKSHLSELVSRVHDYHERVTVMVHGRPSAVLIARRIWSGWRKRWRSCVMPPQ